MQCGDKQHTSKENVLNLCQHRNVFYDDYGGDDDDFQFLECLEHPLESIHSVRVLDKCISSTLQDHCLSLYGGASPSFLHNVFTLCDYNFVNFLKNPPIIRFQNSER